MLTKDFLPALSAYSGETAGNAASKKALLPGLDTSSEEALVTELTGAYAAVSNGLQELKELLKEEASIQEMQKAADFCHDQILGKMEELRAAADRAEALIPDEFLPYPTYDQLLFSL